MNRSIAEQAPAACSATLTFDAGDMEAAAVGPFPESMAAIQDLIAHPMHFTTTS
jgi:hypothetical protein